MASSSTIHVRTASKQTSVCDYDCSNFNHKHDNKCDAAAFSFVRTAIAKQLTNDSLRKMKNEAS